MGFATPLALLLLTALTLPWLVHRMRQRDLPNVQLPTIALLQRAMAVTQRRRALEDLLLMLTRMALIALLVLALAAPFVWSRATFASGQPLSLALVIDDSMSMQRRAGTRTLLNEAISQAQDTLRALPVGSQVTLIVAGRPPRTLSPLGTPEAALQALESLSTSPARGTELAHAIALAEATLSAAAHEQRRILVLSDLAGPALPRAEQGSVEVRYLALPEAARDNVAIIAAKTTRDPEHAGAFIAYLDLVSSPSPMTGELTIELRDGDTVLAESKVAVTGARARVTLPIAAEHARERSRLEARLQVSDALAYDNQRALLLQDALDRHVLLVNGDPRPTHSSDELHFLSRALPLSPQASARLALEVTDAFGLARASFDGADLVWLANVEAPERAVAERLRAFVRGGGGLIISGGDRVDAAAYNALLGDLLPARIEGTEALAQRNDAAATASGGVDFDSEHAGADAWGIATQSIGHGITRRRLAITNGGDVVLRYTDGAPALVRRNVGNGRVALWTTTMDGDWTDLPFRPGYLALTASLVHALAPNANTLQVIEPGQAQRVPITAGAEATLVDPQGTRTPLTLEGRYALVPATRTLLPGAYGVELVDDNGVTRALTRSTFVVAPPSDESDLTPHAAPSSEAAEQQAAGNARVRHPFDSWVFLCVAPLFLLEAWLRTRRHRAAATNIARSNTSDASTT